MSRETFKRAYRLFLEGKTDKPWPNSHGLTANQAHNIRRAVKNAQRKRNGELSNEGGADNGK